MAKNRTRKRGGFLDTFRLEERFLRKYDRKLGQPGLLAGFNDMGEPVLVKVWNRQADNAENDLEEIWHHEVRQLHRLGGYPDPGETIAPLSQAQSDKKGFYLVLRPGQRRPLPTVLEFATGNHWLLNQRAPANRARLWRNLHRIVSGLEILHSQGLLHRNLDRWSILTSGGEESDFQLTGFEWSLRLISAAPRPQREVTRVSPSAASFLEDWKAFGRLAADLLRINVDRLQDQAVLASDVSEYLTIEETRLLRNLVQAEPLDRLDGELIARRIAELQDVLQGEIAATDAKFCLVVRLGVDSKLSESIREAFSEQVEIDDIQEQVDIIKADLGESALLLAVKVPGESFRLVLQGKQFLYALYPYVYPRGINPPTWQFAYCDRTDKSNPAFTNLEGQLPLESEAIEVITAQQAFERYPRSRGKTADWSQLRASLEAEQAPVSREMRFHQALALTQFIETLFAVADVFPVEVKRQENDVAEDMTLITAVTRQDIERNELSEALGLAPPARRLDEMLHDDNRTDEWVLTEGVHLGERHQSETTWRFTRKIEKQGLPPAYCFTGPNPPPLLTNPVLIPGDFVGRDVQFRRRIKALRALADHSELQKMLVDQRRRILDSHDRAPDGAALVDLDDSKRKALEAAIATLPLFLVQGPPGVGKTRLVRDLVTQTFKNDETSRILLTAQSNAAIDHLLEELHEAFQEEGLDILSVRCRAKDSSEDSGPYEIADISTGILKKFAQSELAENMPGHVKTAIRAVAQEGRSAVEASRNRVQQARAAFDGLLIRASSLVFATTNSLELERLIDEKGQFDWAVVEEAGKATGGELLSPLLLSHRRLLIGDHKQLSPFNSERIIRLLNDPEKVRKALSIGQEFIGRTLRDPATDEILDELEAEEEDKALPELCSLGIGAVLLFEKMIEDEFAFQAKRPEHRKIAHRLSEQHRMHPAIARVISKAFYAGQLKSHKSIEAKFAGSNSPIEPLKAIGVPDAPIVIVDMPYLQSTVGLKDAEKLPRWHNPNEVKVVEQVLGILKPKGNVSKKPRLAILSPYREQLRRLRRQIDENVSGFTHLAAFAPAVGPSSYCGTVDSFQGNQAEVVIVSMVRNNHHAGARGALGFLSDPKRMNVLLSRARWRLILVGSIDFLHAVLKSNASQGANAVDLGFLRALLEAFQEEKSKGNAVVVRPSDLPAMVQP
jgi:hypothetical protein